jgi:DNA polymerase-4
MDKIRKIIHIDMDAFYASVEQRDRPELKGKPIVVGGDPNSRGVVAACSYEARKFGIHSAMASSRAYKLCPHTIFLRPRFDVYKSVSTDIRAIFHEYTDIIEPLSLDEAFLDVTENKIGMTSATLIAQEILKEIYKKTGRLTASAGVSFNKFLAKVASDFNKPNGITVVTPDDAADFIDKLPIRKFFGVGKVTEKKMHNLGIKTGDDLKKMEKEKLITIFGKAGHYFYDIAHGIDNRPVESGRIHKSIGKETTFREDIDDKEQMIEVLERLASKIENLLKRDGRKGMTVTLKVKYLDFKCVTKGITVRDSINDANVIMKYAKALLDNTEAGTKKVRLLGIYISNFEDESRKVRKHIQLSLPFNG